jgi:hypothetical protein
MTRIYITKIMKKKDAKLTPPKKLKLIDYELYQTLGTG